MHHLNVDLLDVTNVHVSFPVYFPLCPADLLRICQDYHERMFALEGEKWDLERNCKVKVLEVK